MSDTFTITKSRKHHISMGNYEFIEVGAEITSHPEVGYYSKNAAQVHKELDSVLDAVLQSDLEDAYYLTAVDNSYIHDHRSTDYIRQREAEEAAKARRNTPRTRKNI